MHRGLDRATIFIRDNVQNAENGIGSQYYEVGDEIKQYLDCRYMSPVDAIRRILKFDIRYHYSYVKLL